MKERQEERFARLCRLLPKGRKKPLARSSFARLLPEGRKNVGEGFGEWSEALLAKRVLGQAKRA